MDLLFQYCSRVCVCVCVYVYKGWKIENRIAFFSFSFNYILDKNPVRNFKTQ